MNACTTAFSSRDPVASGQRNCPPQALAAELLFKGNKEVVILYRGEEYRLRITRNDKLILTK